MPERKSDLSRAFAEDGASKTHIGGQALIEGVMMRGRKNWACAVRQPDGSLYTEEHDLASGKKKNGWMAWPLVRGCVAFVESLALGFKALEVSAMHAYNDPEDASVPSDAEAAELSDAPADGAALQDGDDGSRDALRKAAEKSPDDESFEFGKGEMAVSMVLGIVLGVALFIVAPAFLTNLLVGEYDANVVLWNLVDGLLRVAVFVFYIWLIGRLEDIKRMFSYHGAEHKTIHCHEHGLPLTPENARSFPRLHVRCGTAFLIMVMIIAILVYTIVPVKPLISAWGVPDGLPKLLLVMLVRILFLPVIAGIAYEITVKWAGSHPDNPVVKIILWPGMQMQRLTTNEPDDGMLECAIEAMKLVIEREKVPEEASAQS